MLLPPPPPFVSIASASHVQVTAGTHKAHKRRAGEYVYHREAVFISRAAHIVVTLWDKKHEGAYLIPITGI